MIRKCTSELIRHHSRLVSSTSHGAASISTCTSTGTGTTPIDWTLTNNNNIQQHQQNGMRGNRNQYPVMGSTITLTNQTYFSTEAAIASNETKQVEEDNVHVPRDRMGNKIVPIIWTTHRLQPEQIIKVDTIFHKLLWLDIVETNMVITAMNNRLGKIKMTPKKNKALTKQLETFATAYDNAGSITASVSDTAGAEGAVVEDIVEVVKLVDLKLVSYDEKSKIKVIKEIRSIVDGLGLKEAKELVEGAPKIVHKGIKPEIAEEMKLKLLAVGAQVEIS